MDIRSLMNLAPVSEWTWNAKYRHSRGDSGPEDNILETWRRVAAAIAAVETDPARWESDFNAVLSDFLFLPGGRVMAGAGTGKCVTLFNCFVSGPIRDSIPGILDALKETAVTMQQGGGIGCDFSALRPSGVSASSTGSVASGPLSFMKIWDSLCETLLATSTRRGAMMGTLRCDHPDIEAFISAKHDQTALNNFNLSVLVSDDFMRAVAENAQWQLVFPADGSADGSRESDAGHEIHRCLPARELWQQIVTAAHASAEPGVLFIDTINRSNNLYYCETISATNPCGEIPLPPYGACDLGSINLTVLARNPFTEHADFDWQRLRDTVGVAVRFLDNVIEVSRFPLDAQARKAHDTRRIGLGVTGLADLLAMLGLGYGSEEGRRFAAEIMETVRNTAYAASVAIAKEKGAFPLFDQEKYLSAPFVERLPERLRAEIAKHGIRNSHLLAIAPAATISLLASNVSSGVEPIYSLDATREVHDPELGRRRFEVRDYAYARWRTLTGQKSSVPEVFVTADELPPGAHLAMQACLQPFVDNAISKTVNLAADASVDDVAALFAKAYSSGLKGCTVFRSGSRSGQVLRSRDAAHCCDIDREAD